jgi:hypothetical protein
MCAVKHSSTSRYKNIAVVDSSVLDCGECGQSAYCIGKNTDVVIVDDCSDVVCGMVKLYLPKLSLNACRSIVRGREIRVVNNAHCAVAVCSKNDEIATNASWVLIDPGECVLFFEHAKWYFC